MENVRIPEPAPNPDPRPTLPLPPPLPRPAAEVTEVDLAEVLAGAPAAEPITEVGINEMADWFLNPVGPTVPMSLSALEQATAYPCAVETPSDPATKPVPPSLVLMSAVGPWLVHVQPGRDRIVMEGNGTRSTVFPIRGWPACSCSEWAGNKRFGRDCLHVRLLRAVGLVPPLPLPENGRAA